MTIAFVLGNGLSRQGLPLHNLKELGTVYGCNSLYTQFVPDVLVATDRPISRHIQESGYSAANKFYTRRPLENSGAWHIPKPYYGFSSGPVATAIAALDQHDRIYMIGFDMGPTPEKTFNNVYAGTEFYKPQGATPTYTGNWVKQITRITEDFATTKFYRIHGTTTANVPEFDRLNNLVQMPMSTFLDLINNQKDL
jgi:hypothetical protein